MARDGIDLEVARRTRAAVVRPKMTMFDAGRVASTI
jgi:hypothetical protein